MGESYMKIVGERIRSETRLGASHIHSQICRTYTPSLSRPFTTSSGANPKPRVGLIGWYLDKLDSNPLSTKTITTSIIYAVADLSAQTISSPSTSSFDWIRTLRMAGYGFVFLGPSQHLWFNYMSKLLPERDMVTTLKKIFLGQAIYGPANATLFFSYNAALQDLGLLTTSLVGSIFRFAIKQCGTLVFWQNNPELHSFQFYLIPSTPLSFFCPKKLEFGLWDQLLTCFKYASCSEKREVYFFNFSFNVYIVYKFCFPFSINVLVPKSGESSDEIVARLKRDLLPTLKNGLMYWPICDFATYKFVPVHLQPLVNSACAYLWTIYLTYMASLQKAHAS